jgi:hypothetical protein
MLGLGFPQLILILAGICFMVAGIYGLAPSLVTTMFGGRGSGSPSPQGTGSQQSRQQEKAERARQHAEQAKAQAEAKAERERLEAIRKAEQVRVNAEKKRLESEKRQLEAEQAKAAAEAKAAREAAGVARREAEVMASKAKAPEKAALHPAATFTPAAGSLTLADIVAPVQQATTTAALEPTSGMDQELVDELFAEMFALRSTVADLVGEVHQLRTEQKPRRFVIEEVAS